VSMIRKSGNRFPRDKRGGVTRIMLNPKRGQPYSSLRISIEHDLFGKTGTHFFRIMLPALA
jgi:hypothetical protein